MNPWLAKAVVLLATIVMMVIRAPHGQRSRAIKVVKSQKGRLEIALLTLAWLGFFIPLIWVATSIFAFAEYRLRLAPFVIGTLCLALGLWFFQRSHADLGTNWSITLELREKHQLITHGTYKHVRHPMYAALMLYSLGQMLAVPNWVAGPSYLLAVGVLFVFRVHREERMMLGEFDGEYKEYMFRTKRLVPGVW